MSGFFTDAVVVGAGVVGLACARALALAGDGVIVLEALGAIGQGVSSRNSEVLHAGIYYPTGSLRARLCVEGNRLMRAYCAERGIALDACGKLVVATCDAELAGLAALAGQAHANGVPGVSLMAATQACELEPALACVAALHCETSAVFDSHGAMLAMRGDIEDAGGVVALNAPFRGAEPLSRGGWRVRAGGAEVVELDCRRLVVAAGLGAQDAALAVAGFPVELVPPRHLAKGHYFALTGRAPFARLIYPLPVPGSLGTHYRRDLGGIAHFGPDLEWVTREDYTVDPARMPAFVEAIRRYWPALDEGCLAPDYAGIRPKIHGPGEAQPDFAILLPEAHGLAGLAVLFGIESPGLTSSLAIGAHVGAGLAAAD